VVIFLLQTDNQIAFTEKYEDETTIHRYRVIRIRTYAKILRKLDLFNRQEAKNAKIW
jgi:hypothetical protein